MSRIVNLSLDEGVVVIRCHSEKVGISAIEPLPQGVVASRPTPARSKHAFSPKCSASLIAKRIRQAPGL